MESGGRVEFGFAVGEDVRCRMLHVVLDRLGASKELFQVENTINSRIITNGHARPNGAASLADASVMTQ